MEARHDEELQNLLGKTRTIALHRLLIGREAMMHALIRGVTEEPFRRARTAGHMRAGIDDEQAVGWIQTGDKLREFLVPAFATVDYLDPQRGR